jgi:hypothetical protein
MVTTYNAMLKAGRLDWGEAGPPRSLLPLNVPVQLTIVTADAEKKSDGPAMAAALAKIAETTQAAAYEDPSNWQQEVRQDRTLAGRKECY